MTPEEFVDRARRRGGLSVKGLSELSGIAYQPLQRRLQGKTRFRLHEYLALCVLLGLDPRGYQKG